MYQKRKSAMKMIYQPILQTSCWISTRYPTVQGTFEHFLQFTFCLYDYLESESSILKRSSDAQFSKTIFLSPVIVAVQS